MLVECRDGKIAAIMWLGDRRNLRILNIWGETMRFERLCIFLAALCGATVSANAGEWESIFDGKTLENWDGDPEVWSVKDGALPQQPRTMKQRS